MSFMTKRLIPEVAEKVNRPFLEKMAETAATITHHFEEFEKDKLVIAFSGGKESGK